MSFLKKVFGIKSWEEMRAEADEMREHQTFGPAKLAYERALAKVPAEQTEARAEIEGLIGDCCDDLARARIAIGEQFLEAGDSIHEALALEEFRGALEIAHDEDIRTAAQEHIDGVGQRAAVEEAAVADVEQSDEERIALIAGRWSDTQSLEYDRYDQGFLDSLLAMQDGRFGDACDGLNAVLADAKHPCYLHLELGRALLGKALLEYEEAGKDEDDSNPLDAGAATEALRLFLSELEHGEGEDSRLAAHVMLARVADTQGDVEAALAEYAQATDAMPRDSRVLLEMGRYLRSKGFLEEALATLESAQAIMSAARPDWTVYHELGLTQRDLGRAKQAIGSLEAVQAIFKEHDYLDFPPEATVALAELYEADGRFDRAADNFRSLTEGSDRANHFTYYRETARLLFKLGAADEGHDFLTKAEALAPDQEAVDALQSLVEPT